MYGDQFGEFVCQYLGLKHHTELVGLDLQPYNKFITISTGKETESWLVGLCNNKSMYHKK